MSAPRKPWELKVLEGRPADITKGKARGEDVVAEAQRIGLRHIGADTSPVEDWGRIRKAEAFFALIVREFEGVGFFYKPDLFMVGQAADCLERYHVAQDAYRAALDDESRYVHAAEARREMGEFYKLSGRLGLDPQTRSKFTLNETLAESIRKGKYEWD